MVSKKQVSAELQKLDIQKATIKIKGTSPLIMHRWDPIVRQEMLRKTTKQTVPKRAKDPEAQYQASIYRLDDGNLGFPVDAFKQAAIRGAKQLKLVMVDMRTSFFIEGIYCAKDNRDLVPIKGKVSMREDMVRVGNGGADIRFRGQVVDWEASINIEYNASIVSFDQLVNMFNAAGFGVGVGDWRGEKNGPFGRFKVVA